MINCLIIDDEPLARDGLADYVEDISFLQLKGKCENALEAIPLLESKKIDLIFLDIQMPKLNGLDFLKSLKNKPLVIITTAYPSFALEGFQLDVLDYLVKPITFQRLLKASTKAKNQFQLLQQNNINTDEEYFFVKCETTYEKIRLDELAFVQAMQNYVQLHTSRGKFTTLIPLKNVLEELPENKFVQVHKSYIVAIDKIDSLEGNQLKINEHKIPISRANRELVINQLVKGKLLRK